MTMKQFIEKCLAGENLTIDEASAALELIMTDQASDAQIAGLLVALRAKGETVDFLGFTIRRVRSRRGVWWPQQTPQLKKRTALLRKLKEVFRSSQSQPVARVIIYVIWNMVCV